MISIYLNLFSTHLKTKLGCRDTKDKNQQIVTIKTTKSQPTVTKTWQKFSFNINKLCKVRREIKVNFINEYLKQK